MPGPAVQFSRRRLEAEEAAGNQAAGGRPEAGDAGSAVSTIGLGQDISPLLASLFLICIGGGDCRD